MATSSLQTTTQTHVDISRTAQARRGLLIFFGLVIPISAMFEWLWIQSGNVLWAFPLMWTPGLASVVARLALREGFGDVSFRLGGWQGLKAVGVALVFPLVTGLIAYGIAWLTGLAQYISIPGPVTGLTIPPTPSFEMSVLIAMTTGTIQSALLAAGEEIGWRGYMLTRLVDAGIPRPALVSGLIWGVWHVPMILAGLYAIGPSLPLAVVLFIVTITATAYVHARLRLGTGSVWPSIVLHAASNSLVLDVLDRSTTGVNARLWIGESGILVALVMVVAALIVTRGPAPRLRQPP